MATTVSFHVVVCRFQVSNAIRFENLVANLARVDFAATVGAWDARTFDVWNRGGNAQPWGRCFVQIASDTELGPSADGFHLIQVQGGDPYAAQTWFGPASTMGTWHIKTEDTVAAHEVGHLMGLGEEYSYDSNGHYVNDNPQPAGQPQSIMAQTWDEVSALPEHYDKILAQFVAKCPEDCRMPFVERIKEFVFPPFRRRPPPEIPGGIPLKPRAPPGPDPRPRRPRNPLEGQTIDKIFARIESGRPGEMSLGVEALVAMGPAASAALVQNLSHAHPLRRWACATALGRLGDATVAPALRHALPDANVGVRLAAAVSLLRLRDTAGVQTLIDALGSDEVMVGHPPRLARAYAHIALHHWTGQDFRFDPEAPATARAKAAARWQAWWDAAGPTFKLP